MRLLRRWQDWLGLTLSLWISASPAVFPHVKGGTVLVVAGAALVLIALIALEHRLSMIQEVLRMIVAGFAFSAPWIFHFEGGFASDLRASSVVLLALTVWSMATTRAVRPTAGRVAREAHVS